MSANVCKFDWLKGERGKRLACVVHANHPKHSTIAILPGFETLAELAREERLTGVALEDARGAAREERAFAQSIRDAAHEDHRAGRPAFR